MSDGLNKVMLIGNLGQDPELRYTQSGQAVMSLRLATNESYLQDGERVERTEWHTVVIWGKRAEGLNKFLARGSRIYIEGKLQTRSFESKGVKRYATEINASEVILLGGGGESRGRRDSYAPPAQDDDDNLPY